jgi:hypothetical protein
LIALSWEASAAEYVVTAEVKGVTPTEPAVITSPTEGQSFSNYLQNVSGTCPDNANYVEIVDNNFMNGTAICSAGNTFELSVSLFSGANQLIAEAFDITNDEGPASIPVNVTYSPPAVVTPVVVAPVSPSPITAIPTTPSPVTPKTYTGPPLEISATFTYQGYFVGQTFNWPFQVIGGVPPYAIDIEWGDGTNTLISSKTDAEFSPTHVYNTAGGFKGSYTIKVYISDSIGNTAYYQAFVIINAGKAPTKHVLPAISSTTFSKIEKVLWPVYGIALLMVISFWLGEREEFSVLGRRHKLRNTRS